MDPSLAPLSSPQQINLVLVQEAQCVGTGIHAAAAAHTLHVQHTSTIPRRTRPSIRGGPVVRSHRERRGPSLIHRVVFPLGLVVPPTSLGHRQAQSTWRSLSPGNQTPGHLDPLLLVSSLLTLIKSC